MKEFIEKLIGRLKELKELHAELIKDGLEEDFHSGCEGMCVDIIEIVNQLAEEYKDGWIACSERLPEIGQNCICTVNKGKFTDAKNDVVLSIYKDIYIDKWNDWYLAWMPLPEPYKGE